MTKFKNKYRIESARIPGYDYSQPNWYYVTINTKFQKCFFGNVIDGKMILIKLGKIVNECWDEIPKHFQIVELDNYIIMPNHVHGIIVIKNTDTVVNANDIIVVETGHAPSLQQSQTQQSQTQQPPLSTSSPSKSQQPMPQHNKPTLGNIVGSFKSAATKRIHEIGIKDFQWQTRFYDRIIRNERELYRVRKYIEQNPLKWEIRKDGVRK